jgi:hypothetical protein
MYNYEWEEIIPSYEYHLYKLSSFKELPKKLIAVMVWIKEIDKHLTPDECNQIKTQYEYQSNEMFP